MQRDTYFFEGIGQTDFLANAFSQNKEYADFLQEIQALINRAKNLETKDAKIDALKQIVSREEVLGSLTSNQVMNLYTSFRNLGMFDEMINLYNNTDNLTFKESLMVQELLIVAYNKTNQYDKSIELATKMIENNTLSGDVYGGLGKAYLTKSDKATTPEEKQEFLEKSKDAYEEGFLRFAEFYPGINAVYRYIQLGNHEMAKKLANVVYLACKKEGAEETNDYWATSTMLEAACIAGKDQAGIETALKELLKYKVANWQFESTLGSLKKINEIVQSDLVEKVVASLENKIAINEQIQEDSQTQTISPKTKSELVTKSILKRSYNYRGLASNFEGASKVGGNFRFGGQLPDHSISRKDIELFDNILKADITALFPENQIPENLSNIKTFSDIENVDEYLTACDSFIRFHYGTNNFAGSGLFLENNAEINNSIYDKTVNSVIELSGKKGDKLADSRTNIATIFALGMGDCRHHAQVKQIMFDRWQSNKMQKLLIAAYASIKNNDTQEYTAITEKLSGLLNLELRTIDVQVSLPIATNSIYDAKKTQDGKYIATDANSVLEEHTMNILISKNENGLIEKAKISDSFYQNTYKWADFDIDVDNIEIIDGEFSLNAGFVSKEKVDKSVDLPISLTPAAYAGKRDQHSQDEHGNNLMLLGIPIKINTIDDFTKILRNRESMEKSLKLITEYNQERELNSTQTSNNQQADS